MSLDLHIGLAFYKSALSAEPQLVRWITPEKTSKSTFLCAPYNCSDTQDLYGGGCTINKIQNIGSIAGGAQKSSKKPLINQTKWGDTGAHLVWLICNRQDQYAGLVTCFIIHSILGYLLGWSDAL